MKKVLDYHFREVTIVPPQKEVYYQMFINSDPTPFVYSESQLLKAFEVLESSNLK